MEGDMGTKEEHAARLVWQYGEPIHAVIFFAPETRVVTDELGLKGGWMSYFGCRAAPLGTVPAAAVTSIFYGFHPRRVERAIPDAWTHAEPRQLIDARLSAMDAALGRLLGDAVDGPDVRRAASLASAAVHSADFAGRPLGAANAALADPGAPHLQLWQALGAMREHRGDGHVTCLVANQVDPCESLVMQAATGRSEQESLRVNRGGPMKSGERRLCIFESGDGSTTRGVPLRLAPRPVMPSKPPPIDWPHPWWPPSAPRWSNSWRRCVRSPSG
jgi:hypothetical protein